MFIPLLLLVFAVLAGAVVAYGPNAVWAQYPHGLDFIIWSRRLEWPLVALSIILCLTLLGLIVSGKRRAWWLIGLGPVLALFVHRFVTDPAGGLRVIDSPDFVTATEASVGDTYAAVTSRSYHANGVNILLMDGSVRFVNDSIPLATWRALGTRAGNEVVGDY